MMERPPIYGITERSDYQVRSSCMESSGRISCNEYPGTGLCKKDQLLYE